MSEHASHPRIRIRHLFISPGHNYRGHHGQPAGNHPILEVDHIECVAQRGVRGDRYFDHQPDFRGQITFFDWEIFERMRRELQLPNDATVAGTRRNVILEGVALTDWIGTEFEIQGVRFAGTEECRPCYWMNDAFRDARAETWLRGHGGLRARILTSGVLRRDLVNDSVESLPSVKAQPEGKD
jgi:MOSC domain-containing protein YiiM